MKRWRWMGVIVVLLALPACLHGGQAEAGAKLAQGEIAQGEIAQHRARIDAIDAQVVALLSERAQHALAIGRARRKANIPESSAKARQEQVLAQAAKAAQPPLPPEAARRIYATVLTEMVAMQHADAQATGGK